VPEFGRNDLRELLVDPYRVVYRRSKRAVEIVTVWHQRRGDLPPGVLE
jgi:plasmid stabilization system protein ParE